MNVYVFWRTSSVPALAHVPRTALAVAGLVLWGSYISGRMLSRRGMESLAAPLEWIGSYWLGIVFFLLVGLIAVEIITGFGFLFAQQAPTLRGYGVLVAGVLSLVALVQGFRAPGISSYEVRLAGLPLDVDGTVVAVATDVHVGETIGGQWLSRRVEQIQSLRPDLIILGGDIIEGDKDARDVIGAFRRLSAPLGVFAVTGNHEFYAGVEASVRFLERAGIQVLRDRWVELRPGLMLAGVDDLTARRQYGENGSFVEQALAGRPNPAATILVSHTPWQVEKARDLGAGLMFSGHTHAGQIWPFAYLVRIQYPFVSGKYDLTGMTLLVCRGTGTWGPRMRLWRRSEILRITLRAA